MRTSILCHYAGQSASVALYMYQALQKADMCSGPETGLARWVRRHLLDNLDDKPTDETERPPMKNKISFSYCFFILTYRASPVSGPLHRLATVQQAFLSAWYMHNARAAD